MANIIDIYGREFLECEYQSLMAQGVMRDAEVETVIGIEEGVCNRCLNDDILYLPTFLYKGEKMRYCRKCIDFGMVTNKTVLYRLKSVAEIKKKAGTLNKDFQLSFLQTRASAFSQDILAAKSEGLIWAVCGAGKTEMMFESISKALYEGMRVCWAIPRADVVIDLAPRLKQAFPYASIVTLHGNSTEKSLYGDIVVTTVHQTIRFYQTFDFLIIDEVDAFPYTFDEMLVRLSKRACKPQAAKIFLSATPEKKDQLKIKKNLLQACIVPARYHLFPLDVPVFKWCPHFFKTISKGKLPHAVGHWFKEKLATKRRCLLFVPTIQCGLILQKTINKALNLSVEFVYSSDDKRGNKVASYKENSDQFLITTMILERGVTIPNIDVAVFAAEHEVFAESALVQISGRVGRNPKWPKGEIIFFHHGITKAMIDAQEQIMRMNNDAKKQGLLKDVIV